MKGRALKFLLMMFFIFFIIFSLPVESGENTISIKLKNYLGEQTNVSLEVVGNYVIEKDGQSLGEGLYTIDLTDGVLNLLQEKNIIYTTNDSLKIVPKEYGTSNRVKINNRSYIGTIDFQIENENFIRPINTLLFEDYLKGVVPMEMPSSWELEALKAQSIAARTYAKGFGDVVITDTQSHQVYGGYKWFDSTNLAIEETKGEHLTHDDKLVGTYYSSSNGGKILSNTNSWGTNLIPYLLTKDDPYDLRSNNPNKDWSFTLNKEQIDMSQKDLKKPSLWWDGVRENEKDITEIENIKAYIKKYDYNIPKDAEVKIIKIRNLDFSTEFNSEDILNGLLSFDYYMKTSNGFVIDDNGEIKLLQADYNKRAYSIRSMIGYKIMKSPFIKKIENKDLAFTVHGGGWGHGIGMSQYGANQMALEGYTYQDILSFYYTDSEIKGKIIKDIDAPILSNVDVKIDDNNIINLQYEINEDANVKIVIEDENGNYIIDLINDNQLKGKNELIHDASGLDEGNYKLVFELVDIYSNASVYDNLISLKDLTPNEPINQFNKYEIKLTNRTNVYDLPTKTDSYVGSLAPQTVTVVGMEGEYYKINTWLGEKWIKPLNPIVPKESSLQLLKKHILFNENNENSKTYHYVSPQTVNVVAAWEGKEWYLIETWVGDKWINLSEEVSKPTEEEVIFIHESAKLYSKPTKESYITATVGSQELKVVKKDKEWYLIKTWLGEKWISPRFVVKKNENKIEINEERWIYNSASTTYGTGGKLVNQTVTYVSKHGNWYKVKTWLGEKYIRWY